MFQTNIFLLKCPAVKNLEAAAVIWQAQVFNDSIFIHLKMNRFYFLEAGAIKLILFT